MNFEGEDRAWGGPGVLRSASISSWSLCADLGLKPPRRDGHSSVSWQACPEPGSRGAAATDVVARPGWAAERCRHPQARGQPPSGFPGGGGRPHGGTHSEAAAFLRCQQVAQPSPEHRSRGQHCPPRNQNRTKATSMAGEKTSGSEFPNQGPTVHVPPLLPGGLVPSTPGAIQSLERGLPRPGWATSKLLKDWTSLIRLKASKCPTG